MSSIFSRGSLPSSLCRSTTMAFSLSAPCALLSRSHPGLAPDTLAFPIFTRYLALRWPVSTNLRRNARSRVGLTERASSLRQCAFTLTDVLTDCASETALDCASATFRLRAATTRYGHDTLPRIGAGCQGAPDSPACSSRQAAFCSTPAGGQGSRTAGRLPSRRLLTAAARRSRQGRRPLAPGPQPRAADQGRRAWRGPTP